jgi:uncharacterized protein (UPF0332 family)
VANLLKEHGELKRELAGILRLLAAQRREDAVFWLNKAVNPERAESLLDNAKALEQRAAALEQDNTA